MGGKHPLKVHLLETVIHAHGGKSEFPACMKYDHAARKRGALWPMTSNIVDVTCGNCRHVYLSESIASLADRATQGAHHGT